jgi:hypothetical protein
MTTDYSRPRQRIRSFGAGILSGHAVSQEGVAEKIQDNLEFRFQSLKNMLMGQSTDAGLGPVQRRKEIMNRRQELLSTADGPLSNIMEDRGNGGSGRGGSNDVVGGGSGSISQSRSSSTTSTTSTTEASIASMSEVDKGTKARAQDRGYTE